MAGPVYGLAACVLNILFTGTAVKVWRESEEAGERGARHMFQFSLLYLFLIFAVLLADRVAMGA
jgi:heme o synthase